MLQRRLTIGGRQFSSLIARIQTGSIAIAGGSTSQTGTIFGVDLANTILAGWYTTNENSGEPGAGTATIKFNSNVQLQADQESNFGSFACTYYYILLEFVPGVLKSIQTGRASVATPITITAVDPNKAWPLITGFSSLSTSAGPSFQSLALALAMASATSVTVNGAGSSNYTHFSYAIPEFN